MVAKIIKSTLLVLILIVFGIVLGSYSSEGSKVPILILAALVGIFLLNWLGEKSWVLVFIAPPVLGYLPLGPLSLIQPGYLLGLVILVFWSLMWLTGRVQLRWRSLPMMDFFIALILILFIASYIRYPVGIRVISLDTDFVGGKEYVECIVATLFYVVMSIIPVAYGDLKKTLRIAMWLAAGASLFMGLRMAQNVGGDAILEGVQTTRFSLLGGPGMTIFMLLVVYYTPFQIVTSLWRFAGLLAGASMVLFSGFREQLGVLAVGFISAAVVHKQIVMLLIIASFTYGSILLLSSEGVLRTFPFGIQRALYLLPGVDIEEEIKVGADHSKEWREKMWEKFAEDERTGYIKDYVWGDGFGLSVDFLRLQTVRSNRGDLQTGELEFFARTGKWHSGKWYFIHRLGYVGLGVFSVVAAYFAIMILKTLTIFRPYDIFPYAFFLVFLTVPTLFIIFFSVGSASRVFDLYYSIALVKVLFCIARENKLGTAFFASNEYVPIIFRDNPMIAKQ